MDDISLGSLLPEVVKVAEKAGEAILDIYAKGDYETKYKEDNSPLTRADMESHNIILDAMKGLDPALEVLSEESKEVSYEYRKSWNRYWLVDPLDGTKEFIKRSGEFTVNIALIENGRSILGVVYAPAIDRLYYAAKGLGAFKKEKKGKPYAVKASGEFNGKLKIVASRFHATKELELFLNQVDDYEKINMGSSLKLCLVADGSAHLYPRLGHTMEWDTAAANCIVTEAGGNVTDLLGNPLRYNKPDLLNPNFIVYGNHQFPFRTFLNSLHEQQ